jgi:large subunit ribosomal protein L4e
MKVPVYDLNGRSKGDVSLGHAFSTPVRPDMIKRAVLVEQSRQRQPYGSDPLAGQRTSAKYKGRRGIRNSMMNREIARMKRIVAGGFLRFRARSVPQAIKGRKAHPPKAWKNWELKMNKKEKMHIPLVLDDKFQELKKNKDVIATLVALGLADELERCSGKKRRAGRGKMRGRRTIKRKGPLIVIAEDKGITKASKNIQGVEISTPKDLSIGALAPGTTPGRLTIWTKSAASAIEKIAGG